MGLVASPWSLLAHVVGQPVPWWDGWSPHGGAGLQGRMEAVCRAAQILRSSCRSSGDAMGY